MKKSIVIIASLLLVGALHAVAQEAAPAPSRVPAIKTPIERELPNGDTLTFFLRGDEHMHYTMTLDGWMIKEDKNGYFYYLRHDLRKSHHDELKKSMRKAHNEPQRSKLEKKWLERHGENKMVNH